MIMFFYVFFCNITKVNHFRIVLLYCYIYNLFFTRFHMHMPLSNQLNAFFYHHLNLTVFNINLLFFYEFFIILFNTIYVNLIYFIIKLNCFSAVFIIFKFKFSIYDLFFVSFPFLSSLPSSIT